MSRRLKGAIVITWCLSSVIFKHFSTFSLILLNGFQWNFADSKCPRSSLKFAHFRLIPQRWNLDGPHSSQTGTIFESLGVSQHGWKNSMHLSDLHGCIIQICNFCKNQKLIFVVFWTSFWSKCHWVHVCVIKCTSSLVVGCDAFIWLYCSC